MADTVKVRTTMRPDEEIEVSRAEFNDLERQNLLVTEKKKGSSSNGSNSN